MMCNAMTCSLVAVFPFIFIGDSGLLYVRRCGSTIINNGVNPVWFTLSKPHTKVNKYNTRNSNSCADTQRGHVVVCPFGAPSLMCVCVWGKCAFSLFVCFVINE